MVNASDVINIIETIKAAGVKVWLDGGWGVDALLGEQTRPHKDVDVVVSVGDVVKTRSSLIQQGFKLADGGCATNFALKDGMGRKIDIHATRFDEQGNGVYRMCNGKDWIYPAEGFLGKGKINGLEVGCLSAKTQMLCHTGYELGEKDFHEIKLLHERFGIDYPTNDLYRAAKSLLQ